jgi:hypothetical protein
MQVHPSFCSCHAGMNWRSAALLHRLCRHRSVNAAYPRTEQAMSKCAQSFFYQTPANDARTGFEMQNRHRNKSHN